MIDLSLARPVLRALEKETKATAKAMRRGAASALNKTARTARTQASREVRKVLALKAKRVNQELVIRRASATRLEARIVARFRPIPLQDFNGTRLVKSGVSAKPRKDRPRYVVRGFEATMPSGHRGYFKRVGKLRLPIKELFGPPVMGIVREKLPELVALSEPVLRKNLDREIGYYLSKI